MDVNKINSKIGELDYEFWHGEVAQRLSFQNDLGHAVLKSLVLVNGGAIIALFTFIAAAGAKFQALAVWWSFAWFVIGLVAAITTHFFGYFAQGSFMGMATMERAEAQRRMTGLPKGPGSDDYEKSGHRWFVMSIFSCGASLACFAIGAGVALSGVLR